MGEGALQPTPTWPHRAARLRLPSTLGGAAGRGHFPSALAAEATRYAAFPMLCASPFAAMVYHSQPWDSAAFQAFGNLRCAEA